MQDNEVEQKRIKSFTVYLSIYVFSAVLLENSVQYTLDEKAFFYFLVVNTSTATGKSQVNLEWC